MDWNKIYKGLQIAKELADGYCPKKCVSFSVPPPFC